MNRQPPPTANQPQVDVTLKIYSSKQLPTIRVTPVGGGREMMINASDFDPDRFVRVE